MKFLNRLFFLIIMLSITLLSNVVCQAGVVKKALIGAGLLGIGIAGKKHSDKMNERREKAKTDPSYVPCNPDLDIIAIMLKLKKADNASDAVKKASKLSKEQCERLKQMEHIDDWYFKK